MIEKYREVFLNNPLGLEVLTDILKELRFGSSINPDNQQQVCQHNLSMMLLAKCGILASGTLFNVVRSLASVSPEKEDKERYIM